jgi:hypothetical protein
MPIGLIVEHTVNDCSGVPGPSEVCIHVLDMHDQPAVQLRQSSRRREIIANSVQPDPCPVKTHLAVHDRAVWCSFVSIGRESEHSHQVIVHCFDVFVHENGDHWRAHTVHGSTSGDPEQAGGRRPASPNAGSGRIGVFVSDPLRASRIR